MKPNTLVFLYEQYNESVRRHQAAQGVVDNAMTDHRKHTAETLLMYMQDLGAAALHRQQCRHALMAHLWKIQALDCLSLKTTEVYRLVQKQKAIEA